MKEALLVIVIATTILKGMTMLHMYQVRKTNVRPIRMPLPGCAGDTGAPITRRHGR